MGDRANIVLWYGEEEPQPIYLYSHWDGPEMATIAQDALKRGKPRWGDDVYLGRIIFSQVIKDAVMDETGYGLSPFESDNSYPHVNINLSTQTVTIQDRKWSFEEYVEEDPTVLENAMLGRENDPEDDED